MGWIVGGAFNDEKEGFKNKFQIGSVGMANSGSKNSSTSQFFIVLPSTSEAKLAKLTGKYVCFGQVVGEDGIDILRKIEERFASPDGKPREKVWISECGLEE